MDTRDVGTTLQRIFEMGPRERYASRDIERLHRRCVQRVGEMSHSERRMSLSRYVRDVMLSDDALEHDRGWQEVLSFLDWIDGGME